MIFFLYWSVQKNNNMILIPKLLQNSCFPSNNSKIIERRSHCMSCCHCSKNSGGPQETVVLQIWQKKWKKLTCMTFLCIIALRNKTVSHAFLWWLDNVKGRLCQERLLRSRNFATMVMRYHTTLLYSRWLFYLLLMQWNSQNMPIKRKSWG